MAVTGDDAAAKRIWVTRSATATRPKLYLFTVIALLLLGVIRVLPGLADEIWQDEAATLLLFASQGVLHPFVDYTLPNNHMLFSAVLAALWSPGQDPQLLRLLMLGCWGLTLLLFAVIGPRVVGRAATLVGLALLAASSLAIDFGLQLRGYAFSWPWTLLTLLAALRFMQCGLRRHGTALAVVALANVLILPTNLLGNALCVLLAGVHTGCTQGFTPAWRRRAAMGLVLATSGIGYYVMVWVELLAHAGHRWSDWSRAELLGHWALASTGQFLWFLPLAGLAVAHTFTRPGFWRMPASDAVRNGALALMFAVIVGATVLTLPLTPFPRNLVPLLPLAALVIGALLMDGLRALGGWANIAVERLVVPLALVVFAVGHLTPACGGLWTGRSRPADLCRQFYHQDYSPPRTWQALRETFADHAVPVMLDAETMSTLALLRQGALPDGLDLVDFRQWAQRFTTTPAFAVADSEAQVRRLLERGGMSAPLVTERLWSTGHFKLYRLHWTAVDE
jgi:hypothetical protein